MKKIISILTGITLYIISMFILTGYGNLENHPSITDEIVDKFKSLNNKGQYSMTKFKNYFFDFSYDITSENYEKSVMFYRDLRIVQSKLNVKQWISRGSLTADVPEVQASVRHFYDPTQPVGSRYLQDIAIGPIMSRAQEIYPNPGLDDVDWAIYGDLTDDPNGPYNHKFCWENGKKWFKEALETENMASKDSLMGLAWRALGETLHMIEDHGCPAHVRDDSHPAPRGYGSLFGDPDTYEELMADVFKTQISSFASSGKVDPTLKTAFQNEKTVRDLAHTFAVWTNKNFFTNETIYGVNYLGENIAHKTHPHKTYTSPKIDANMFDPNTKYYEGKVAGFDVKHCVDRLSLYEFFWQGKKRGYPLFDKECVKSQAEILIPNIVEAGVNVIKLFVPEVIVEISNYGGGSIAGSVTVKNDAEYTKKIEYNGLVEIRNLTNGKKLTVKCMKGGFNESVSGFEAKQGDKLEANISFGGIRISSNEFEVKEESSDYNCNECKVFITYSSAKFSKEGSTSPYWDHELCSYAGHNDATSMYFPSEQGKTFSGSWTGNTFRGSEKASLLGPGYGNITVQLTGDGKAISYINLTYADGYTDHNNFIVMNAFLELNQSIPVSTMFDPNYMMEYKIVNPPKGFISSFTYKIKCKKYTDMIYTLMPNDGKIDNILVRFSTN